MYYERIDINGDPERLPKEKGEYMICNRQSFYMQTRFNPKLQESKRVWLKEVTWYEVPITREEIIALANKLIKIEYQGTITHEEYHSKPRIEGIEQFADELIGGK